ncbi:MAG: hypothetical protein K1X74_14500 [Pirellulales bacterium]|nr:hypothetical protein [Pirellulales bacterium]
MIKKVLLSTVAAAALAGMFFGRDAWSYFRTAGGWVKDSVRSSVPVEFEIERARKMLHELQPDIRHCMHVIAKEEVELSRLENEIASVETKLNDEQAQLKRLSGDLAGGGTTFQYAGHSYTADQVKADLANRFKRYKTKDATLASLRKIHDARGQSLLAARQNLDGMLSTKRQLEVEIENVEARRKMVEAAQTTCSYHFDDSRLSRLKQLVSDIATRLEVDEKVMHVEDEYRSEIPVEESAPSDIVDQVTSYFESQGAPAVAANPAN